MQVIFFNNLLIVGAIAVAVPLMLGLAPGLRVPAVVLEIVVGMVVGPSVLGWVHEDVAVQVLSDLGLGYLLFVAGFEIDVHRLRSRLSRVAGFAFLLSAGLALATGYLLHAAGLAGPPLLLAIILMATSLGVLVPLLKDAEQSTTEFGQLVMAAGSMAELAPIVLVSVFFSATSTDPKIEGALAGSFIALTALAGLAFRYSHRWGRLIAALHRLEDTSAQLRVRIAITLALAFAVVAQHFGLAMILGAFLAGVIVKMAYEGDAKAFPPFENKLQAIGFGFLIPIFFVTTGVELHLKALAASPAEIVSVPVFLAALVVVRGLPALTYLPLLGPRKSAAAGFFQSTSLTFIIVATAIGTEVGKLGPATAAALVLAGLVSVIIYPQVALAALGKQTEARVWARLRVAKPPEPL